MRDAARIAKTLSTLEHYWRRYPDLRLGQIVGNFATDTDPYFIEDEELERRMEDALQHEKAA